MPSKVAPEHPPDDHDQPDHEGAPRDDQDRQHVVLDRRRNLRFNLMFRSVLK